VQASVSRQPNGDLITVVVSGDVDLAVSASVEHAILDAVGTDGVTTVIVDLSAVDFLDSSGITLLLKGRRRADERGVTYRVTGARDMARQVLEITGVWAHLSGGPGHSQSTAP
jgi:anti-sigma B factor antagonist